jgi:MFS family permease
VKFDVPIVALAFALSFVGGAASVVSSVAIQSTVQSVVGDRFRGRVLAALGASGALFSLLGAVVGGVAARAVGATTMLNVAGVLIAIAGFVALRWLPASGSADPRQPDSLDATGSGDRVGDCVVKDVRPR